MNNLTDVNKSRLSQTDIEKLVQDHYRNKAVKKIIMDHAKDDEFWRAGNGDFSHWYKYYKNGTAKLFDLSKPVDYDFLTKHWRTLYWTLNYFDEDLKKKTISKSLHDEKGNKLTIGGFADTMSYDLGVDIDAVRDIKKIDVQTAVSACAQFIVDSFRKLCPNSVYSCFSGGGIYVYLHHGLFIEKSVAQNDEEREHNWHLLTGCFNTYIQELQEEFRKTYPEYKDKVKIDALNNRKRLFKTILSIHRKHPFAVIPLDVNKIEIDLKKATLPLSQKTIEEAREWGTSFNTDEREPLIQKLGKYIDEIKPILDIDEILCTVPRVEQKINLESFPPCLKKSLTIKKSKDVGHITGASRIKAFVATFLYQAGYEKEEAKKIFKKVSSHVGGPDTNIFESYYSHMRCPNCSTINKTGASFPSFSMGELGICKPDEKCELIKEKGNPFDYLQTKEKLSKMDLLQKYNVIIYKKIEFDSGFCKYVPVNIRPTRLAELFMNEPINNGEKYHWITLLDDSMNNKREIYYYDNGYYKSGGEGKIKSLVNIYIEHLTKINHKREIISFIEDSKAIPRHKLEPPVNLICFKNGVYNIETKQLEKHDPKHYFVNQIPVEYHPEADCPKIKKFFGEVLQPEYVDVLQEMFGYCFYRKYFMHVIFILHGTGRNGKGITVSLLMRMLGRGNYSTRKLHDLMTDRFAKADLFGVMANVGGEISGAQIKNSVEMKHLSGGEFICGEKKFMGTFSFENYAKMIFNANKVPSTIDKTDSFYQRIVDIPYMESFFRGDAKTKTHLLEELISKKEMEGLLIWALEGLHRLIKEDRFSKEYDPDEMDERYELIANPVRIFLMRNYVFGSQQWIEKKVIIDKFKEWAKEKNIPYNVTTSSFTRTLRSVIKGAKAYRKMIDGERYEGYIHIQEITENDEEDVQIHDDVDDFLNEISEI